MLSWFEWEPAEHLLDMVHHEVTLYSWQGLKIQLTTNTLDLLSCAPLPVDLRMLVQWWLCTVLVSQPGLYEWMNENVSVIWYIKNSTENSACSQHQWGNGHTMFAVIGTPLKGLQSKSGVSYKLLPFLPNMDYVDE